MHTHADKHFFSQQRFLRGLSPAKGASGVGSGWFREVPVILEVLVLVPGFQMGLELEVWVWVPESVHGWFWRSRCGVSSPPGCAVGDTTTNLFAYNERAQNVCNSPFLCAARR